MFLCLEEIRKKITVKRCQQVKQHTKLMSYTRATETITSVFILLIAIEIFAL